MTKFEGCYLTNAGRSMVYDNGLPNITFTRAVTGSGIYTSKEDIPDMTELKEQRQEFGLDGFSEGEDCTVNIKFKINNTELQEGYQLSEIGIYAKSGDGEEVLYCVGYAIDGHTEEVPAHDGTITYYMAVTIDTVISNDANVSIVYSEEHEWAKEYIDSVLAGILSEINEFLGTGNEDGPGFTDGIKSNNMVGAINEVFQLCNENKKKLVESLVARGIQASTSETWKELLNKVLDMTDTSSDTVTAAALLAGYTAHNAAGTQITGILADKTGNADYSAEASLDASNLYLKLKVPAEAKYGINNYLYATYNKIVSLIGLTAAKLVKGNTILGITGNDSNMDTSGANAAAGNILSGKKAAVKGSLITGTMKSKAGVTVDAEVSQDDTYTYMDIPEAGYYDENSKLRSANSNLKLSRVAFVSGTATLDFVPDGV
ncbi:MAG: hypothetical protein K2G55_05210, partial [Lachnospiraceae bacterium]|nr:hypothetical protein [Lachnospiraceae bacterium]